MAGLRGSYRPRASRFTPREPEPEPQDPAVLARQALERSLNAAKRALKIKRARYSLRDFIERRLPAEESRGMDVLAHLEV